ncbi:MAG TPA: TIGR01458 family HAD-type hydrolase [Rubrobacteraceae bacterium]|nr:TIGR01458 family HAD-type hydrolase [Rubrobacteraceae bacterium]
MNIKGLLTDLDGTLFVGEDPVPGAREAVEEIKSAGIHLRYVTNTTRRPRRAVAEQLRALGFEVEDREIFTPARAAAGLIGGKSCLALVDESLHEDLEGVSLTGEHPEYVLIGDLGKGFTYERLDAAFRRLMDGAELVALQKNRYWQTSDGLSLDAGPFVAALEYASGKTATVVGKPERGFFALALREMGLEASEAAMIGDDAEADVAGARRAGLTGIQVRTGKWRPGTEESGADLTLDSFADLPRALGL